MIPTKEITEELSTIFQSLEQQGKEPTIALVKARLSCKVPMPALIVALKNWKNTQRVPKIEVAVETLTPDAKIAELEQKIIALTQRVERLKAKQ